MSLLNLGLHCIIMNIFTVFNIIVTRVFFLTFNDLILIYCTFLREVSYRDNLSTSFSRSRHLSSFSYFLVFNCICSLRLGKIKNVCMSACVFVCMHVYSVY